MGGTEERASESVDLPVCERSILRVIPFFFGNELAVLEDFYSFQFLIHRNRDRQQAFHPDISSPVPELGPRLAFKYHHPEQVHV